MKKSLQKIYFWLRWKLYDEDFCLFAFFILLLVLLICCGCKSPKYIREETIIRYVDSTVVTYRDSLIEIPVPVEKIIDIVPIYDSLHLESSVARASAWVDTTTHTLKGELENKPTTIPHTVYLPSKEHIVYKDSIQTKEVPVEVVKVKQRTPKWAWYAFGILGTLVVIGYRKYIAKGLKFLIALV